MSIKGIVNNENGFSLISTVIASAVGLIVIGAMAKMFVSQHQNVAYLEDRLSKSNLKSTIQTLLTSAACQNTLSGQRLGRIGGNAREINILRDHNNNVAYQVPQPNGKLPEFEMLRIKRMELQNISVPTTPNSQGNMRLTIYPTRIRDNGGHLKSIDIDLQVGTDASGLISQCFAVGSGSQGLSLNAGQMPCIMDVTTKLSVPPSYRPPGYTNHSTAYMPGVFPRSGYKEQTEIFAHGTTNIATYSFTFSHYHCSGPVERVFLDTYTCNDKKLIRTSHTDTGEYVMLDYNRGGCGP